MPEITGRPFLAVRFIGTPLQHAVCDFATRAEAEKATRCPSLSVHTKSDVMDFSVPGDMCDDIGPGPWPLRKDLIAHVGRPVSVQEP